MLNKIAIRILVKHTRNVLTLVNYAFLKEYYGIPLQTAQTTLAEVSVNSIT